MGGDGFTGFSPSFAQLEDVCLQALEQCVTAAGSIPRVGGTSTKGKPAVTCCVTSACFCHRHIVTVGSLPFADGTSTTTSKPAAICRVISAWLCTAKQARCLRALEQCVNAAGSIFHAGGTSTNGKPAATCCMIFACFLPQPHRHYCWLHFPCDRHIHPRQAQFVYVLHFLPDAWWAASPAVIRLRAKTAQCCDQANATHSIVQIFMLCRCCQQGHHTSHVSKTAQWWQPANVA